jgi:2-haloacid dehalogenase
MTLRSTPTGRHPAAFVFDAYGTLFDVQSVAATAEALCPGRGAELSRAWRVKQLEYTWLQSLMATNALPREDFAAVTAHALDYAAAALTITLGSSERAQLLAAYLSLAPYPDTRKALLELAPRPRWILSNGTLEMLEPVVRAAELMPLFDGIISVDAADIYKPAPRVYALATARLQLPPSDIGFVSSNCWDAIGARAFGFTTFWINRTGAPVDRHGPAPDFIIGSLAQLPDVAG